MQQPIPIIPNTVKRIKWLIFDRVSAPIIKGETVDAIPLKIAITPYAMFRTLVG